MTHIARSTTSVASVYFLRLYSLIIALAVTGCSTHIVLDTPRVDIQQALNRDTPLDGQLEPTASGTRKIPPAHPVEIDLTHRNVDAMTLRGLDRLETQDHVAVHIGPSKPSLYVIDSREEADAALNLRGHLLDDPDKRIILGIHDSGVSGFFELADGSTHALAYSDNEQVAGIAGDEWMTDRLPPKALRERAHEPNEVAPVKGSMPIDIDLTVLTQLNPGDQTVMQFPGMGSTRVTMDRIDLNDETTTWVGHLTDYGQTYPVLMTYSPEAIEGSALTPRGEVVLTGGHAYNPQLLGLVNAKIDGENCAAAPAIPETASAQSTTAAATTTPLASAASTSPANTIDVLVYYSPDMETVYGSATAVATRVDALFAAANQAYGAGNLGYMLRRVGLKKIAVSETLSNDSVLSRLQASTGEFSTIRADRDASGADLVTVIRPLRAAEHASCGVAYVGGYGSSDIRQYMEYMTSVVGDGNDRNGARYYCDTMTLAHETGHNLGLMHDRTTVASQGGGSGVKPYAFGFAVPHAWGTIMSYTSPVQYRFSNPNDRTCPGSQACGVDAGASNSADNVLALSYSLPWVSAFRAANTTVQTKVTVSGLVTLDGKPVAGVSLIPSNAGVTCTSSGSTGIYTCQAASGTTFNLTPNLSLANGSKPTWTPAAASFTALATNATANFNGVSPKVTSLSVTGKIILDGKAQINASIKVSGSGATCGTTNSTGAFTCTASKGASFSLTPNISAPAGYRIAWTPPSITFTNLQASSATANFSGASSKLSRGITGVVSVLVNGARKPLSGASLKPSISGVSCGTTSSTGSYSCSTTAASSFTLVPSYAKPGYTFKWMPASIPGSGTIKADFIGSVTCPSTGCKL